MATLSFLLFCLGVLFGAGVFFRKGGEKLATYVLFPVLFVTLIMGLQAGDIEAFFGQINKAAVWGTLLGLAMLVGYHTARLRSEGALSFAGALPNLRLNFRTLWTSGQQHAHDARNRARTASTVYYHAAIKLGAITTMIDKTHAADGFAVIKATFNLNRSTCPDAQDIFNTQMRHPQRLRAILAPFLAQYGSASAIGETLIFGMCKVALADGAASAAEVRLIDQVARALGLGRLDTRRIIASAGIHIDDEFRNDHKSWQERMAGGAQYGSRQSSGGRTQSESTPQRNERETHLATLGLPANASARDAKSAWRKLAKKYHPDKLVSQNLPADEMAKAETMMQAINEAYDWLKERASDTSVWEDG